MLVLSSLLILVSAAAGSNIDLEEILIVSPPKCDGNSICGFLQVNNKGLTTVSYCECEDSTPCSMQWDQFDGQSVSQAKSDQYKYCGASPVLPVCSRADEVAYTSRQTYRGDQKIGLKDEIHCLCLFGSTYQDVKFDFQEEEDYEIVEISYYCMPLRECNATDWCKDITEQQSTYIVNPKCICGDDMVCPSISQNYSHTERIGEMNLNRIKCQPSKKKGKHLSKMPHHLRNDDLAKDLSFLRSVLEEDLSKNMQHMAGPETKQQRDAHPRDLSGDNYHLEKQMMNGQYSDHVLNNVPQSGSYEHLPQSPYSDNGDLVHVGFKYPGKANDHSYTEDIEEGKRKNTISDMLEHFNEELNQRLHRELESTIYSNSETTGGKQQRELPTVFEDDLSSGATARRRLSSDPPYPTNNRIGDHKQSVKQESSKNFKDFNKSDLNKREPEVANEDIHGFGKLRNNLFSGLDNLYWDPRHPLHETELDYAHRFSLKKKSISVPENEFLNSIKQMISMRLRRLKPEHMNNKRLMLKKEETQKSQHRDTNQNEGGHRRAGWDSNMRRFGIW